MIDYLDLARRLAGKHIKDDAEMPAAYRKGARELHDDWGVWPFTRIPRRLTTYRLPMPARKVAGNAEPIWTPVQEGYPLAPDAEVRPMHYWDGSKTIIMPHVLSMHPVHPVGQWSVQAVWLDGEWRPCFETWTTRCLGRRLHHNRGLKPDLTLGDWAWNFPEASMTWTKEAA